MESRWSRRGLLGAATALGTAALVGCGSRGGSGGGSTGELVLPATQAGTGAEGLIPSAVDGVPPMIVGSSKTVFDSVSEPPGSGDPVSSFQILWGAPVAPHDQNKVWQELERRLNVSRLDATMVPYASYADKLATTLASGSLPDFTYLDDSDPNASRALADGAFLALNEYLEGDKILEYPNLATTPAQAWQNSHRKGEILGLPQPAPALNWFPVLRLDAMRKVGTEKTPTSGTELKELLIELAKIKHLGGREIWANGALDSAPFEPIFGLGPTFAVEDGTVVAKIEKPEYEEFLGYMADLWRNGVFHPDALGQVDPELFAQGQVAHYTASFAGYYWLPNLGRINLVRRAVPTAETIHYAPPALEGGPGVCTLGPGYGALVGIPSALGKDPDRVKELLRIANYYRAPFGSSEQVFLQYGIEGRQYERSADGAIVAVESAPNEGHVTYLGLKENPVFAFPEINKDAVDNVTEVLETMVGNGVPDELSTLPNQERARTQARLDGIITDHFNGIVSGRRPISDVSAMRKAWLEAGGQEVKDEYKALLDEQQ